MRNSRVIVTGGAGFIGSHLVDRLVALKHEVWVIDNLSLGSRENVNIKAHFCNKDIRDLDAMRHVFEGVDCVFHLAAHPRIQPSIKNPDESFTNNLLGTHNVLMAAKDAGVKRVVYSGSSSVYGDQSELPLREDMLPNPKNPYALDKLQSEQRCLKFTEWYNLPTVCLRYFNVYGKRQPTEGAYATVIGIFLRQKKEEKPLTIVRTGMQKRDFTYVGDVVEANILAMGAPEAVGEIINIGSGSNYSINEIADFISSRHVFLPRRPGESQETLASTSKAIKLLNFQATRGLFSWIGSQLK